MVNLSINNKNLETLDSSILRTNHQVIISNCIINTIDFSSFEPESKIVIENCIISNFYIHACWFKKGLIFRYNHVINYVDYQMGGHNIEPLIVLGNIFNEFVNFFDCQFDNDLEIRNNIFLKGSNLLGNLDEGFKNTFERNVILENNLGSLNLDGLGK